MVDDLVSIIVPIRNEAAHIGLMLDSLLAQRCDGLATEILAVDGASEDGTGDIIDAAARRDSRIRRLPNPRRATPFAFNIGLREAAGEFVGIFGAHADYDPDYVQTCVAELRRTGAVGVSGRLITVPSSRGIGPRLAAIAMSHPFGCSTGSVRTQEEGFQDTIPFPVFRRQAVVDAGGYDERLIRNQDNDLNQRLRACGHRLFLTHRTCARYRARAGLVPLTRYAYATGSWNAISLRVNARSMSVRHLVPAAFVTALIAGAVLALVGTVAASAHARAWCSAPGCAVAALYAFAATVAAIHATARERWLGALMLPIFFACYHVAYGWGTLRGLALRAPDPAPRADDGVAAGGIVGTMAADPSRPGADG